MTKKILLAALTLLVSGAASANVPEEMKAFVGKTGKHFSFKDGQQSSLKGDTCTVRLVGDTSQQTALVIDGPVTLQSKANIQSTKKSVAGNGWMVFATAESAPQKDTASCGEAVPVSGYVKTVEIKDNAIVIREKFRCGFLKKKDLMRVCDLN